MNLRVPWNAGNFLTSCKPVSFSRRTLHHEVSKYYSIIAIDRSNINGGEKIVYLRQNSKRTTGTRFLLTVKLTTRLHLVPRSTTREALPLLPLMYPYLHVWAGQMYLSWPTVNYAYNKTVSSFKRSSATTLRIGKCGRGFEWHLYRSRNAPVGSRRATESDCRDRVRGQLPHNHGGTEVCSRWLFLQY